jgi:UDP-N-acetylmuramyl pentapeptide phosphotransferase/UDP-N-acetylglucosamine-1-phosphate transferase
VRVEPIRVIKSRHDAPGNMIFLGLTSSYTIEIFIPPALVICLFSIVDVALSFFDGYRKIKKRDRLLKNVGFVIFEFTSKLTAVKKRKGQ